MPFIHRRLYPGNGSLEIHRLWESLEFDNEKKMLRCEALGKQFWVELLSSLFYKVDEFFNTTQCCNQDEKFACWFILMFFEFISIWCLSNKNKQVLLITWKILNLFLRVNVYAKEFLESFRLAVNLNLFSTRKMCEQLRLKTNLQFFKRTENFHVFLAGSWTFVSSLARRTHSHESWLMNECSGNWFDFMLRLHILYLNSTNKCWTMFGLFLCFGVIT